MSVTQLNGGSQIQANTITSGQVAASIIVAAGGNPFTGNQSMGGNLLNNVATPIASTDAANKGYVDNAVQGLNQKPTARVATTGALPAGTYNNGTAGVGATFTVTATGTLTIDGVLTALGDVILVKNQASTFQNGLYQVTTAGAGGVAAILTRQVDMDASNQFNGAFIPVDNEGAANANTLWLVNNTEAGIVVGTTAITFVLLNGATAYTGSSSILISGNVISAIFGTTSGTVCQGNDSRLTPGNLTGVITSVGLVTSTGAQTGTGSTFVMNTSPTLVTPVLGAATATSINGLTITASTGTFTLTNAKTFTVTNTLTLSGTDAATLNIGTGGTLGTGAFVTAANYLLIAKVITRETPTGTVNGSNVTFTLANTPVSGTESVYLNGILQDSGAGNDYTIAGAVITFLSGPLSGSKVRVNYLSQ